MIYYPGRFIVCNTLHICEPLVVEHVPLVHVHVQLRLLDTRKYEHRCSGVRRAMDEFTNESIWQITAYRFAICRNAVETILPSDC